MVQLQCPTVYLNTLLPRICRLNVLTCLSVLCLQLKRIITNSSVLVFDI